MGWIHAGTGGVDTRTKEAKILDKLEKIIREKEDNLEAAKYYLQAAKDDLEEVKKVVSNPPTEEEIEAYVIWKQDDALNFVGPDDPEFPTAASIRNYDWLNPLVARNFLLFRASKK